jgi:hypothetical protein
MGLINFIDKEYSCRSLTTEERKIWDNRVREAGKAIWRPAEDYWKKLGNIPMEAKKACLVEYLRTLNWECPPLAVRLRALSVEMLQLLATKCCPDLPPELITRETAQKFLECVEPYFIEVKNA